MANRYKERDDLYKNSSYAKIKRERDALLEAAKVLAKAYEYGCGWYTQDGVSDTMESLSKVITECEK